jgi:SAM-dependent methyltransferase
MKFSCFNPRYFQVYFYLLHSTVHWQEREDVIAEMIKKMPIDAREESLRIIDFGCGPGKLVNTALRNGFTYLGIDTDPNSIDYCRQKYYKEKYVSFTTSTIPSPEITIGYNDIIILNGVMHHLDDNSAKHLVSCLSKARFIIIADHYSDNTVGRWPKFLQKLDRGKYVRDYSFFKSIEGYRSIESVIFPIKIFSFVFWIYFCSVYTSEAK